MLMMKLVSVSFRLSSGIAVLLWRCFKVQIATDCAEAEPIDDLPAQTPRAFNGSFSFEGLLSHVHLAGWPGEQVSRKA